MRRRNVKNAMPRLLESPNFISEPLQYKGKWHEVFNNDNPIYIEIGMGKGKFITEHARRNPNINYIGIEKFDSVLVQALKKFENEKLDNLKLLCFDAERILDLFAENEIDHLFLNFSDPWPKARHAKRRLTSPNFLKLYKVILKEDSFIEFKTDNQGLFNYTEEVLEEEKINVLKKTYDLHKDETDIITTEYEDKFSALGNPIYYVSFKL